MATPTITQSELRRLLSYDPETGVFTWRRKMSSRALEGDVAGGAFARGYHGIRIYGRRYYAHRLAWLYVYGVWPSTQIDHIDRNPSNNCIANLRLATPSENSQNTRTPRDNQSGFKGVHWDKSRGKWLAFINLDKQFLNVGRFDCIAEAIRARRTAEAAHHPYRPR